MQECRLTNFEKIVDSHWQPMALSPFIKKIAAEKATMQVVVENAFKNLKMRIAYVHVRSDGRMRTKLT